MHFLNLLFTTNWLFSDNGILVRLMEFSMDNPIMMFYSSDITPQLYPHVILLNVKASCSFH